MMVAHDFEFRAPPHIEMLLAVLAAALSRRDEIDRRETNDLAMAMRTVIGERDFHTLGIAAAVALSRQLRIELDNKATSSLPLAHVN